jgi:hypothetical protein
MSFQSDIFDELSTLVGPSGVWMDVADGSAAPPYVVVSIISTGGETPHDGSRNLDFPLVQISCYAANKPDAIEVASDVNDALDGNTITGDSAVSFQFSNQFGTYESDTKLFGEILEYRAAANKN